MKKRCRRIYRNSEDHDYELTKLVVERYPEEAGKFKIVASFK
jgi:hypothetical protein